MITVQEALSWPDVSVLINENIPLGVFAYQYKEGEDRTVEGWIDVLITDSELQFKYPFVLKFAIRNRSDSESFLSLFEKCRLTGREFVGRQNNEPLLKRLHFTGLTQWEPK